MSDSIANTYEERSETHTLEANLFPTTPKQTLHTLKLGTELQAAEKRNL